MDKTAEEHKPPEEIHYSFILFVVSNGEHSGQARENLNRLCDKFLPGRHTIRVVDVVEEFQTALDHNILLTPSVVITNPEPRVVIHGDLSDPETFLDALNLEEAEEDER